ncbi:MAG TPA: heparinase II/III family protein [Cytophagaceae bacterium]
MKNFLKSFKPFFKAILHDLKKKTGFYSSKYPLNPVLKKYISLDDWRRIPVQFFFSSKASLQERPFPYVERNELKKEFQNFLKGYLRFFNGQNLYIGRAYDWHTNPENKFQYDASKHWADLHIDQSTQGDLKYIWEKSRFSYLYTIIRYDLHFKEDQSQFVLNEILSWITKNPVNSGPHYISSHEIAIRILNWIFTLHYYQKSKHLTEETFQKIIHSLYWQCRHIAIKSQQRGKKSSTYHLLTEALTLYTVGLLFPFFPESAKWKEKSRKTLEESAFEQILEDGAHGQYSMNYQRTVIQIYTWAFYLAKANKEEFSTALYERLQRAMVFLYQHQDNLSGMLPNYGANNGSIYFKFNNCQYRDYRPQLNALYYFQSGRSLYDPGMWDEDIFWFTGKTSTEKAGIQKKTKSYDSAGFYILRSGEKFSSIRCSTFKEDSNLSENLHLDIWSDGINILRGSGSFKYFSEEEDISFFSAPHSHNTVIFESDGSQGPSGEVKPVSSRRELGKVESLKEWSVFKSKITISLADGSEIGHSRNIRQSVNEYIWEIEDVIHNNKLPAQQVWNVSPDFFKLGYSITCTDKNQNKIDYALQDALYSPTYGVKENSKQIIFRSNKNYFKTRIIKQTLEA